MKTISSALSTHLIGPTTLATCWKITLVNGTVKTFTDHDSDLVIDGLAYAASAGYTPSTVDTNSTLSVDNLEIHGFLSSPTITEEDLNSGLWDYASVQLFMVNWADTTMGKLYLRTGKLGQVTLGRSIFQAEVRGLMQAYACVIGELYSPSCRATLGDSQCGINLTTYTFTGSVTSVSLDNTALWTTLTQPDAYFQYGKITFTSGLNNTLSMEIKYYNNSSGAITMQLGMPHLIAIGDTFNISAGCNKIGRTGDCKIKFNNYINFRGEEDLPGADKMLIFGGQQ